MTVMPTISPNETNPKLIVLRDKIQSWQIAETRERCEDNLLEFVKASWSSIDSHPFVSNWAIDAMCFPYTTTITTSEGEKSIGEIVESKWAGNILSFNHKTLKLEWQPILAHIKSAGKPLIKIKTSDITLSLTDNHPVYIKGRGYVRADQIEIGDRVSVCPLSENLQCPPCHEPVLLPEMLFGRSVRESTRRAYTQLQALREAILSTAFPADWRVLFSQMSWGVEKTPRNNHLSEVRWPESMGGRSLQSLLGKIPPIRTIPPMRPVRKGCLEIPGAVSGCVANIWGILQPEMLWAFNERGTASSVCQWFKHGTLSSRLLRSASKGKEAGKSLLLSLFKEIKARCSSYRSGHNEQRYVQSSRFVPDVPQTAALSSSECATCENGNAVGTTIVRAIEREIRIPDAVYNIEVANNHNYFAESILVHNCDHLEAVSMGHIKRLLVNVPPRCSKTSIFSIIYPAWTWARSEVSFWSGPQVKFLCASYNHSLSLNSSNKMRRLLFSPWYQTHWPNKITLQPDMDTKAQFDNTAGGSLIATSVGGSLLGLGGDVIICDDLNNTEKPNQKKTMDTAADREKSANFWSEVSTTRLNDQKMSALINVQQRTNENDVSGIIIDGEEDFVHLMIPMRYDERRHCVTVTLPQYDDDEPWQDPRTIDGELMWPERFGEVEVSRMEARLGPYMASGRLQQSPSPKGGGIIKRDWWQLWGPEEARIYGLEWNGARKEFPEFDLIVGSLDTSYGLKEENDYNALTIWGIWIDRNKNRRAMLMFAWNKRLPLHGKVVSATPGEPKANFEQRQKAEWGLVEWVADTCKRYRVKRLLIEDKTRGRDVANEINRLYVRENWGVELIQPQGDKVARTHSIVPLFTDNAIWAPDTRWSDAVLTQCMRFPKDAHDDMHDTVTQFLNWARENGILVRADEVSAATEDEAKHHHRETSVASAYGV